MALTSNFSKMFDAWERLVASSARVQDLLGEDTADAAKNRIYWYQSIRAIHSRPFAIIDVASHEYELDSDKEFRGGGRVVLAIEAELPLGVEIDRGTQTSAQLRTNWKERMSWMAEAAECVLIQIMGNSGKFDESEAFLNVTDLEISQGPGEFEDDDADQFMGLVITGAWT
tara:strand:- start:2429 stop:2941 length:513 start_codon:yes stop_codon:yes gene_type:complete